MEVIRDRLISAGDHSNKTLLFQINSTNRMCLTQYISFTIYSNKETLRAWGVKFEKGGTFVTRGGGLSPVSQRHPE